jgi:hypothetical protein
MKHFAQEALGGWRVAQVCSGMAATAATDTFQSGHHKASAKQGNQQRSHGDCLGSNQIIFPCLEKR